MKRAHVLAALAVPVVAGSAWALRGHLSGGPGDRVCRTIEARCGAEVDECRPALARASDEERARIERCVESGASCAAIVGCLTGNVLRDLGLGLARGLRD